MSNHSRTPSELDTPHHPTVLAVQLNNFLKDFYVNDIDDFMIQNVHKDAYTEIINEKNERCRIRLLFWYLCDHPDVIPGFLNEIGTYYSWLKDNIEEHLRQMPPQIEQYGRAVLKVIRANHTHSNYNVHRTEYFDKLCDKLTKASNERPYVVLTGELGIGKYWLVLDVCTDYSVQHAMNFQIITLDVHDCDSPEKDLIALQQLQLQLFTDEDINDGGGTVAGSVNSLLGVNVDHIFNRILELQQLIRIKLRQPIFKNALLILNNVQNVKTWQRFDLGCKLLILTHNKKVRESISSKLCQHMDICKGLTEYEFYTMFERYLGRSRDSFPSNASDIYNVINGHPYLLSIIAKNLGESKKTNWNDWIDKLRKLSVDDNKLCTVLEISLNVLKPELQQKYATFSIFPHSVAIPLKLLAALWSETLSEVERIIAKFHKYSIINEHIMKDDSKACSMLMMYSLHLKRCSSIHGKINVHELHGKVIDYYKIQNAFDQRTEVDLCNSQHDAYFYKCIGYHMHAVGDQQKFFAMLYTDFGFLGQMIREVGLLNTISDLKYYQKEIINGDVRREQLHKAILKFLPNIEDMLVRSADTCLLQYALTSHGIVWEEAHRQSQKFPNRVWFNEIGNFHQRRQIVSLPEKPKLLKFLDDIQNSDYCLVLLDNNKMLLGDLSLDSNDGPLQLADDSNYINKVRHSELVHVDEIIDVQLIRNDQYIVTLDTNALKLWPIGDELRRRKLHRRNSKQTVNPRDMMNFNKSNFNKQNCSKPNFKYIREQIPEMKVRFVAFYIEQQSSNTLLHAVYQNGDIIVFEWNQAIENFQPKRCPKLSTKSPGIRYICKILSKFYVLFNAAGDISCWNTNDSSQTPKTFDWPNEKLNLLCIELHIVEQQKTCIYCIFSNKILRLTFRHREYALLDGKLETLYECEDPLSAITCGRLTRNGKYLLLGTKRGLVVFDVITKTEILRSNVSDAIECVDIYSLDDPIYKYLIICGAQRSNILNIFSLRLRDSNSSICWAHNVAEISNVSCERPQLEPNVWLLGQKLFDLHYDVNDNTTAMLLAADSKNRIHQICTADTKKWRIFAPETKERISVITANQQHAFVGYESGDIFDLTRETFESFSKLPVTYMQLVDEHILVVCSSDPRLGKTLVRNLHSGEDYEFKWNTLQCYKVFEQYLLLINELGWIKFIDLNNGCKNIGDFESHDEFGDCALGGCTLKNSYFILGTLICNIYVFRLSQDGRLDIRAIKKFEKRDTYQNDQNQNEPKITSLEATNNAETIAVGFSSGDIEIYKLINGNISFVTALQSHKTQVNDLKFSPDGNVLVSCAEQICFWHVAHILNNPLDKRSNMRRSSRYSTQNSTVGTEEVDAILIRSNSVNQYLNVNGLAIDTNGNSAICIDWQDKRGPADKPELLACIKFVGNKAQKLFFNKEFTKFYTIDDEGVYYQLTLLNFNEQQDNDSNVDIIADVLPLSRVTTQQNDVNATNGEQHDNDIDVCDDNVMI